MVGLLVKIYLFKHDEGLINTLTIEKNDLHTNIKPLPSFEPTDLLVKGIRKKIVGVNYLTTGVIAV